jgi:hypothetical protein
LCEAAALTVMLLITTLIEKTLCGHCSSGPCCCATPRARSKPERSRACRARHAAMKPIPQNSMILAQRRESAQSQKEFVELASNRTKVFLFRRGTASHKRNSSNWPLRERKSSYFVEAQRLTKGISRTRPISSRHSVSQKDAVRTGVSQKEAVRTNVSQQDLDELTSHKRNSSNTASHK